jgi:peptidoglycan/xylan/chitin deacetylase (PgdA/CDA1 family)
MTFPASVQPDADTLAGSRRRGVQGTSAQSPRHAMLAYHEIAEDTPAYQYTLSSRQFEDHLHLASVLNRQSPSAGRPLALSFDDGHISNYSRALPLLEKYGFKSTFFVIAGRIGERKDFMTWKHLREIVSLGHRVEAHGWSHVFLTACTDSELHHELRHAKETIEDRLGCAVHALSAPHGRWNTRVVRACEEAGYRQLYTSNPWAGGGADQGVHVMGRLVVVQSLNAERLLRWLTMGRAEAALHRAKQNLKDSARHLLGDRLYYQLWSRFSGWSGPEDYSTEA